MSFPKVLVAALSMVAVLLVPTMSAQAQPLHGAPGGLHAPQSSAYVNPVTAENSPGITQPDYAFNQHGTRVEVYTSIGGVDVPQDWRSVNAFSQLVASVPQNKHLYATVFNSLHDGDKAVRQGTGWKINTSTDRLPFTPTNAFLHTLNQYPNDTERRKYVHVLGDKRNITKAVKTGSGLASLITQATDYDTCNRTSTGACLTNASGAIMHSKYAAFEQAQDSTGTVHDYVTWVTSANLNGSSGGKKSNTSFAVYGDKKAYDDMVRLFNAQRAQSTSGISSMLRDGVVGNNPDIKLYPSPRIGETDREADYLASVSNARLGQAKTECRVWVVHSLFSRVEIRDGLKQLKDDGCEVKIILGFRALADVATHYFKMGAEMRELIDKVEFADVHDKSLAVSYKVNGQHQGVTIGGSANLNTTSLTHDELAIRIDNAEVADTVGRHGDRIYLFAKGSEKVRPVTGLSITPFNPTIVRGQSLKLRANFTPSNASVRIATWSSSDSSVASVDTEGRVTAHREGTAVIKALSVSGGKESSVVVTVPTFGSTTPADNTPEPTLSVTNAPELTMQPYQTYGGTTTAVITWSQGSQDLNGKVQLQYSSKGKWKNYKMINVVNGHGVGTYKIKTGKGWRAVARTKDFPAQSGFKATLAKKSLVSDLVIPQVSQTHTSSATPRLYAPTLITSGKNVPYRLSWRNPSTKAAKARIQYYTGKKWVDATEVVLPAGRVTVDFGYKAVKSRKWRAVIGGKRTKSVMVYTQK